MVDGAAYNITTGTDANGDGISTTGRYASAWARERTRRRTGFSLPIGEWELPRNAGTLPSQFHLDTNFSREFVLNPKHTDHLRSFTVNVRSANVLNHTNVTG